MTTTTTARRRSTITSSGGNPYVTRAYDASTQEELSQVYDEWAATFNADMTSSSVEYVAPMLVAEAVARNLTSRPADDSDLYVLDAGCGTGLASVALATRLSGSSSAIQTESQTQKPPSSQSAKPHIVFDGVDFSPAMLKRAEETGLYRTMRQADLNKPLSTVGIEEATYDAVICVGTLTHGHVGPRALSEFAHAIKPDGIVAATILQDIWEENGYRDEVDMLVRRGEVEVVENEIQPYRKGAGVVARIVILRRIADVNTSQSDSSE